MKTKPQTNYQALLERIKSAKSKDDLYRRETQINLHYDIGTITALEFERLDVKIMERLALLED